MQFLDIAIVGIIATAIMSAIHLIAERASLGALNFAGALGAFIIPTQFRRHGLMVGLHFIGGLIFTVVYAYVFQFLQPPTILAYAKIGALIGVLHGFFIGLFFLAFHPVYGGLEGFHLPSGVLNMATHVVFGLYVGLGFGMIELMHRMLGFVGIGVVSLAIIWGVGQMLIIPRMRDKALREGSFNNGYAHGGA